MATVTSASNAPAPTPAQLSQLPENTSSLHYVEDTAASPDESSYFRPVEDVLDFDGQNRYQQDIAAKSRRSATSLSYRDAPITATASSRCRRRPPSTAVPRNTATSSNSSFQTVSLAQTLTPSFLTGQSATAKTTTARPTPSSNARRRHRRRVTPLLDLSVNADWDETAAELDDIGAVTDDATVVSDADSGIVTAFTDETVTTSSIRPRRPNAGLHPLGRWRLLLGPSEGDRFEVIDEVFHLKNSVAKHRPAEEFAAIRSRIARTRERLEKTAWQLEQFGSAKAAGYLRRWLPSIVTFAEHAVEGFEVPWTSNPVERLMGEVSKRCKNQWMRWTAEGLEAIPNFGW